MARTVPWDEPSEMALLGAAMLSPSAFEVAVTEVETADFYLIDHQQIHAAMLRLYESGATVADTVTLWTEIDGWEPAPLESRGGPAYLLRVMQLTPATSNARRYASIIVDCATRRDLIGAGGEIAEIGYTETDAARAVDMARTLIGTVDLPIGSVEPSPTIHDLLNKEITQNWLVPGLIERQDRLILTGPEGGGKSTLLRQCAVCMAAGMHPFQFYPIEPIRVLVVDVENTEAQNQRKYHPMVQRVWDRLEGDNLRIEVRTQGLDLLSRHDHRWLLERVAANKPDLLITGPIYKLHAGDPNEEGPARKLAAVFDAMRGRFGTAIILEAHSPHGSETSRPVRPYGASLWMRWPEFGYGLRLARGEDGEAGHMDFVPFRGARDARDWPHRLNRGGEGNWPWVDAGYTDPSDGRF
jgi:hypothetical protein